MKRLPDLHPALQYFAGALPALGAGMVPWLLFLTPSAASAGVRQVSAIYEIAISPDSFEDWPIPLNNMVSWEFEPADEEKLRLYIAKGRADAEAWSEATGVLAVLQEGNIGASKEDAVLNGSNAAAHEVSQAA